MPYPQQSIDWPGIRALAVAIGVREAARRSAADLPEDEQKRFVLRVLQRSHREGWIVQKKEVQAAPRTLSQAKPLSSPVIASSDAMAESLSDDSKTTRLSLSKAAKAAAIAFSERSGEAVIKSAKALREITSTAATLHGWEQAGSTNVQINLALGIGGVE